MSTLQTMIEQAMSARDQAYAVYSNFKVGACIRTANDRLFSGFNIENASYSLTLCAEATAIASMKLAGFDQIEEVVVISSGDKICSPCGACRQRIREFADPHCNIHCCQADGQYETLTLEELLPLSFGPEHLGD